MKIKRRVVCVFGKFNSKSDFILEPTCCPIKEEKYCEYCKKAFWIEGESQ